MRWSQILRSPGGRGELGPVPSGPQTSASAGGADFAEAGQAWPMLVSSGSMLGDIGKRWQDVVVFDRKLAEFGQHAAQVGPIPVTKCGDTCQASGGQHRLRSDEFRQPRVAFG